MNNISEHIYWQGDGTPMFHPMAMGGYLFENPTLENYKACMELAKELPNGGLAWYYPDTYKVNRMVGKSMYSCIAQAEILSAMCRLEQKGVIGKKDIEPVFESFKDTSKGGINYKDILLEMPLKNNYPEVILNGWLHAILRIIDYYKLYNISDPLLENTLRQLGLLLHQFEYRQHRLSLYSNMSPYFVEITKGVIKNLSILYNDRVIDVKPRYSNNIYDIQWWDKKRIVFGVSFMSEVIIQNDKPFTIVIYSGQYCPTKTIPGQEGHKYTYSSKHLMGKEVIKLEKHILFNGYPTNFIKLGMNYYHTHHVVALDMINKDFPNPVFKYYSDLWKSYMDNRAFVTTDILYQKITKGSCIK